MSAPSRKLLFKTTFIERSNIQYPQLIHDTHLVNKRSRNQMQENNFLFSYPPNPKLTTGLFSAQENTHEGVNQRYLVIF